MRDFLRDLTAAIREFLHPVDDDAPDSDHDPAVILDRWIAKTQPECQGADFRAVGWALGQGLIDHADRDGLKGVKRAVFMDRGGHAPGEPCPSASPVDPHQYWCQYPDDECICLNLDRR